MDPERVYFTWPDRRFRYECRGCGACCKGHGIGIDAAGGQLVQLLANRPQLAAFVRRRGDAVTAFNPRDRCWFLADDGLCRVEVEDGRAAKPASCRLFPFNRVFQVGAWTVVDFNSVICPMQAGEGVSHAEILEEIATIRDPAIVGSQLPPGEASVIESEHAIASQIFAAPGDLEAAWRAQTTEPFATPDDAFTKWFGAAWARPGDATLANAIWLTPSMRFNELFGPRRYARKPALLARMWLAWLGFAALGEQLARRALSMQELTTIWSEQAPLMHAVARWSDAPILKPGPIELPNPDPGNAVRALAQACIDNKKAKRPLSALAASLDPAALKSADAILRAAFTT